MEGVIHLRVGCQRRLKFILGVNIRFQDQPASEIYAADYLCTPLEIDITLIDWSSTLVLLAQSQQQGRSVIRKDDRGSQNKGRERWE